METCAHLQWNYLSWRLSVWCDLHKEYDGQGGAPPSPPPSTHLHLSCCNKSSNWMLQKNIVGSKNGALYPRIFPKKKSTWPMPTSAISLRYPNFEPPRITGLLSPRKPPKSPTSPKAKLLHAQCTCILGKCGWAQNSSSYSMATIKDHLTWPAAGPPKIIRCNAKTNYIVSQFYHFYRIFTPWKITHGTQRRGGLVQMLFLFQLGDF